MINEIIMELNNRGYKAESTTVVKNGVEKVGVIIGEGTIRPTIYPNLNLTVNECIREIINTYENAPKMNININEITNWEYVKNNLQLCLQRKTDENILKRDYLDMEMYSNMVHEVNETQVEPEEVLSNHAYFFNKETCEISW